MWSWGGTSWNFIPLFFIHSLNSSEHSLSNRFHFGCMPFSFNRLINFWYYLNISPAVLFLIGSIKMLLLSSSNSTIIYIFPQNNVTGNEPFGTSKCWDLTCYVSYTLWHILPFPFFLLIDTSLPISVPTYCFVDCSPYLILRTFSFHISSASGKYFATDLAYSPVQDA